MEANPNVDYLGALNVQGAAPIKKQQEEPLRSVCKETWHELSPSKYILPLHTQSEFQVHLDYAC